MTKQPNDRLLELLQQQRTKKNHHHNQLRSLNHLHEENNQIPKSKRNPFENTKQISLAKQQE
jgi:hypothetical protein